VFPGRGGGRLPPVIVDCGVYEQGERQGGRRSLREAIEAVRASDDGFAWIGLETPAPHEFAEVAEAFGLHPLAVEDAVHARQRPKLEVYDDTLFFVLKPARYVDEHEIVELSQLMLFVGERFLITVRHGDTSVVADVRREIAGAPDELKCGPIGVVHALVDRVVDEYGVVIRHLDVDIDEVEQEVFSDLRANAAERIYKLKREVLEFRQAVLPLAEPLDRLVDGKIPQATEVPAEYFRDVHDHVLRAADKIDALEALLTGALSANLAQVGVRQNEDMRKVSGWVAILAVPTMIAGIYGMNFEHMPELGWLMGYPFALGLMAAGSSALYVLFRRRHWL
jgi:magnesium transporter